MYMYTGVCICVDIQGFVCVWSSTVKSPVPSSCPPPISPLLHPAHHPRHDDPGGGPHQANGQPGRGPLFPRGGHPTKDLRPGIFCCLNTPRPECSLHIFLWISYALIFGVFLQFCDFQKIHCTFELSQCLCATFHHSRRFFGKQAECLFSFKSFSKISFSHSVRVASPPPPETDVC